MDKITTVIERQWLREIIAGRKRVEYREMKEYRRKRLAVVQTPFYLRLINGMSKNAPEATVTVVKVTPNKLTKQYEFQIGKVVKVKNWDRKRETPMRTRSLS